MILIGTKCEICFHVQGSIAKDKKIGFICLEICAIGGGSNTSWHKSLLLGHWYEIMALYYVKSILTEISASRQDRRVLQKNKIIRIEFLSKWGMLQTSRYV